MGKSSPSPPPAPDPAVAIAQQAKADRESTIAGIETSLINQITPGGNLTFNPIGETEAGNPQFEAVQTLSPEQQRLFDLQNQAGIQFGETANQQLGSVSDLLSQPIDFASLGAAPVAGEEGRQAVTQAILARQQPQIAADRQALESRLANQGVDAGSQAFDDAFRPFNQGLNDLRLGADIQGGAEQSRQFGLETAARNQALNEQVQQRQIPLNELIALTSNVQVAPPSFVNTPQANFPTQDVLGATFAANNAAQQNFFADRQQDAANRAGLFGLGAAGISSLPFFKFGGT